MSTTPHSGSDREIQQELERTKSEAAQLASGAADAAKRRGREAADSLKGEAADRAEEIASALETTAEDLESADGGEMLSGYGRSMAELMRRFAGGLREHEIEEFAAQLASFARRNPASFLAGSVALGFGVSRFLKATSTRSLEEYGYGYGYDDEDEYLLDEDEGELDLDETDAIAASDTDYDASSGADYGASSDYEATRAWPEDRGRERPGAGSSTERWSPAVSSAPGETTPGDEPRSDDIGRNEP